MASKSLKMKFYKTSGFRAVNVRNQNVENEISFLNSNNI